MPSLSTQPTDPTNPLVEITPADDADFPFVAYLRRIHSNAVGYLPEAALRELLAKRTAVIGLQNGQEAGVILYRRMLSSAPHICPIVAAAVDFDAQRRHTGLALTGELERIARANGSLILQAWCRADLDATHFWRTAGFLPTAIKHGRNRRNVPLILWRKPLGELTPAILHRIPPRSGWKARRTDNARRLTAAESLELAEATRRTNDLRELSRDL